jgi:catechol 2,3-dioxygenase-like lactoylglutathione lyase family enzyme
MSGLSSAEEDEIMNAGFTPLGLDHIVLRVRDQEVSKSFYCDNLGCTVDDINERISLVQLRFGEQLIDLLPEAAGAARGGLDHFCLSIKCDDLGKVAEELRGRGVTLDSDVVSRRGAYGRGPSIYIKDPDGYRIELKPRL